MQAKNFVFQKLAETQAQKLTDFEQSGMGDINPEPVVKGKSEPVDIRLSPWGPWLENQGYFRLR